MVHSLEQFPRYTGREFEADMLGEVDIFSPKFQEALNKVVITGEDGRRFVSYRDALDLVKKFQPADPKNPKKDFLRELRLAVAEKLGLETTEELETISAYTAVRTPLDVYHGVDGFIEIKSQKQPAEIVTLDLSLNPEKEIKADIFVGELPDPDENEDAYLQAIEDLAEVFVSKIRGKEATA